MRSIVAAYRDAYSGFPRGPWVLAGVCLINRCGTMVLPFLALYLTKRLHFSAIEAGVVLTLYGAGAGVGAFWGGALTDRFGAKSVQVASLAFAGLGFLLLGQLRARLTIQLAAFALAVINEAFRPANATAFAAQSPPGRLTQVFTLRRLAINLGMTCGPALGGVLAARDYRLLFLVDGGTCLIAAAVLAWLDRSPAPAPGARAVAAAAGSPWRDAPFRALLALAMLHAAVLYQFFSTYPLALREVHGFDEPKIGSIYAINTLLIVALEMVLVRRLSSRPPLAIAAWGSLLFCGGFALLPIGRGYGWVAATVVVWTFGEMLTMPFLETVAAARGDAGSRGSYLGAYNFAYSLAFAGAPLLGTAVYQRYGPVAVFAGCGALGVALWFGLRTLSPLLARGKAHSVPVSAEGPAVEPVTPT
jgi:predicted MFS family arabinose efflux permease